MTVDDRERTATRLLRASAEHAYDPDVEIDWDAPLTGDWFVPPHRCSLYGTELWDDLSEQQRITLTRHEVASVASLGVWFETILMQLLIRSYYEQDPTAAHAQYALTEVADECRHSVMFGRMIAKLETPHYAMNGWDAGLGRFIAATGSGPRMYAAILIAEEVLDALQREASADERVQPLVPDGLPDPRGRGGPARAVRPRGAAPPGAGRAGRSRLAVRPDDHRPLGLPDRPPPDQPQGVRRRGHRPAGWAGGPLGRTRTTARRCAGRGARVVAFLEEMDLIGGPGVLIWKKSGLL